MKYLFAPSNQRMVRQFALSKVLLAFDYDGTLAPIVVRADRAAMRATTRELFIKLASVYPCVVISGRARADVKRHLYGVKVREVIGNHGAEPWQLSRSLKRQVKAWRPLLQKQLAHIPGICIEDKTLSVAIHYRAATAKKAARSAILQAAESIAPVRVITGKQVINILPQGAYHKGMALEKARVRYGCDTALYVGDDQTDEDVFSLNLPNKLLTVRVGAKQSSSAGYYLRNQGEIDRLLRLLSAYSKKRRDFAADERQSPKKQTRPDYGVSAKQ
jgi:trehalose 6-phosphate phosphatase